MAKRSKEAPGPTLVDSIKHTDTRKNMPTREVIQRAIVEATIPATATA